MSGIAFLIVKTAITFGLGFFVGYYFRIDLCTVREYECALLFKKGKFIRELGPGKYNLGWHGKVKIIDMRQDNYFVSQNVLTSDNIQIGINITVRTRVKDAYKAFTSSQNYQLDTNDTTRSAVKETGRKAKTKTILKNETLFERRLFNRLAPRLKSIGIELVNVELIDAQLPTSLQESIADKLEDLVNKDQKRKKVGF